MTESPSRTRRVFEPMSECAEALELAWSVGGQHALEAELLALVPLCLQEMDEPVIAAQLIEMLGIKADRNLSRRVYTVLAYQAAGKLAAYCYEQENGTGFTRWWIIPKEDNHAE